MMFISHHRLDCVKDSGNIRYKTTGVLSFYQEQLIQFTLKKIRFTVHDLISS